MQTRFPSSHVSHFPELEELLNDIQSQWESELQSLSQVSLFPSTHKADSTTGHPLTHAALRTDSRPPRSARRRSNRKPLSSRRLRRHVIVFCALTGGIALWQVLQPVTQVEPSQKLRRVMSQNTLSKVAAFRKEIAQGDHFMPESDKPFHYIVQEGDTVAKLARKFHIHPNTIIKNNDPQKLKSERLIPGTRLTILPVDGITHPVQKGETLAELAQRYKQPMAEIIDINHLDDPHMLVENQPLIIPNASELRLRAQGSSHATSRAGKLHTNTKKQVYTRTSNRLSWPSAGIVTSNFGWRWFRMHQGMDIAAPLGTPIRAAKEGRVVASGWMGGYGYAVDVDHGRGLVTRYAHCSELHVRVGEWVTRGQVLATVGSTGHSTGPHLHFEVHLDGEPVNPRHYF